LGFFHPPSSASGELPALAGKRFRGGGRWSGGATIQHGSEFGDLNVDSGFLRLETGDGGFDDSVREFWCRHISLCSIYVTAFLRITRALNSTDGDPPSKTDDNQ
jgi:hypothetical protein